MQVTSCAAACFGSCVTLYIPDSGTISPGLYAIGPPRRSLPRSGVCRVPYLIVNRERQLPRRVLLFVLENLPRLDWAKYPRGIDGARHEEITEWIGRECDHEVLDLTTTNQILRQLFHRSEN